jgi:precorrin-6Y C5,15-methyltransferase (decarboxylating)
MQKWLSVVEIGEDGVLGLNWVTHSLVEQAEVLVGGDRHLNMLPEGDHREKLVWASPLNDTIEEIIRRRGQAR